ncbi:unnamed protein product [Lampetra planeri]
MIDGVAAEGGKAHPERATFAEMEWRNHLACRSRPDGIVGSRYYQNSAERRRGGERRNAESISVALNFSQQQQGQRQHQQQRGLQQQQQQQQQRGLQ